MKKVLLFLLSAVSFLSACHDVRGRNNDSQTDIQQIETGCELPVLPESVSSQIMKYEGFTLSFNKTHGTPNWVAWELLGSETEGLESRKNYKFWKDDLVLGCVSTKDYTNSGYDRGHMCPAADMHWSADAMRDCFSMANICPQDKQLNRKAWNTLEQKCRSWAKRDSALLIVAGPIYSDKDNHHIAGGRVRVPGAYYKAIVAPYVDTPRGIAFVYPNTDAPGNMQNYAMSIDDLEQITGIDFFSKLPDDLEDMVEKSYSFNTWNRKR